MKRIAYHCHDAAYKDDKGVIEELQKSWSVILFPLLNGEVIKRLEEERGKNGGYFAIITGAPYDCESYRQVEALQEEFGMLGRSVMRRAASQDGESHVRETRARFPESKLIFCVWKDSRTTDYPHLEELGCYQFMRDESEPAKKCANRLNKLLGNPCDWAYK